MISRLLFIFIFLLTPQKSFALSGCAYCASTGNCGQAFHYGPGKYCGSFHDTFTSTLPCCCPNNSQCQLSSTQCNCYANSRPNSNSGYHRGYDYNSYNYNTGSNKAGGVITFLILICFCICCCSGFAKNSTDYVPVAAPVNCDHDGNPPATAPGYQSSVPTARSTGNNQGFAWGPALGGFVLGELFAGQRREGGHHHRHHGGGGGGGLFGGDTGGRGLFGGDTGGGGGGFSFGGDTGGGGGGFSFGGDTGGGGGGFAMRGDS